MPIHQRRVPVQAQVVPASDLGLEARQIDGFLFPEDLQTILGLQVVQTPNGPRIMQAAASGAIYTAPGPLQQVTIIPSRTDTATVDIGPFLTPPHERLRLYVSATAVSGTTPSMTVALIGVNSAGVASTNVTNGAATAITAIGDGGAGFGGPQTGSALLISTRYIIRATITGTNPSFTWYADINYR